MGCTYILCEPLALAANTVNFAGLRVDDEGVEIR
jgi:hypothetical protein